MLGAIIGDIVGSVYEFQNTKSMEFDLITPWSHFTDDSVMTLAVAKWLVEDEAHTIHYLIFCMQELGNRYPTAGYGGNFMSWLREDELSQVISAQINRTFWGVTLGKSTPSQVRSMLVQKGYYVEKEPDGALCIKVNNVRFGGAVWTYISFLFVNNQLSQVWFQNNEKESPVPIEKSYDLLKVSLDTKYGKYYINKPLFEYDEKKSFYSDKKTEVYINIREFHNIRYISLSYEDLYLHRIEINNDNDEL